MPSIEELVAQLPGDLRAKAVSFATYGPDANQMLLTTRDDEVYAVAGFYCCDPLALTTSATFQQQQMTITSSSSSTCFANRIDLLCGKGVCELAHSPNPCNSRYVLLRTNIGELYSFGSCDETSAGLSPGGSVGTLSKRRSAHLLSHQTCTLLSAHPLLQDKKIVQISCGFNHAACLTSYGEIFAWSIKSTGRNQSPHISPSRSSDSHNFRLLQASQTKLALFGCIARRRSPFVEVVSYQDVVVGLDEDGRICEWQFTEHHNSNCIDPPYGMVIELTSDENMLNCHLLASEAIRDVRISHIASGRSHCLAVSNSFAVYAWGSNDCGQLGLGLSSNAVTSPTPPNSTPTIPGANSNFVASPCRVPFFDEQPVGPMKKIKALATHSHLDISVAEAVTGDIYVWGDLSVNGFSACTSRPTWTRCRSVMEALQNYGRLAFTPSTSLVQVPHPTLTMCLLSAFDNPEHADIQFIIPGYSPIYAHRQFLQIRAPSFLTTFGANGWHQGRAVLIPIDNIGYPVVRTFLRFLYTNEFACVDAKQTAELDCDDFISLAELAEMCGETLLRQLVCDHIVSNCLTIENAAFIYSSSLKRAHLEKENSLPAACLSFILANLVDVVRSETFATLDGAIAKRILIEAASISKPPKMK